MNLRISNTLQGTSERYRVESILSTKEIEQTDFLGTQTFESQGVVTLNYRVPGGGFFISTFTTYLRD